MSMPTDDASEQARIRVAYARRGDAWRYDWGNPAYVFAMHDLERRVLGTLTRWAMWPLGNKRILDVGCGTGYWLWRLAAWGAAPRYLAGVDLLRHRIAHAAKHAPRATTLCCGNAGNLPFPSAHFDILMQFTVFTSILDPALRQRVADEMVRVLHPGGAILWYDFCIDNPRNPDVRAVRAAEIRRRFPQCTVTLQRVTLAPPLTRLLAPRSRALCSLLNLLTPLRTHYLGVLRPR